MPIYKMTKGDRFESYEKTAFPDLEKVLEDWIEKNPHLVLEGEDIAIIARQPRTGFDKYLDLLGVDESGATVVIELKRGETPRDVVAQTLEYAAWVDGLTTEQLNELAREYAEAHQIKAESLADLYRRTFEDDPNDTGDGTHVSERVTFNNRQRLVIVAEKISEEVEQTLRYLRTRFGADIYGIQFSVHKAGEETLINTTTVVGREQVSKPAQTWTRREKESDEDIYARVKTDFMRTAIQSIEYWVDGVGAEGLSVDHSTASDHFIRYLGVSWFYYYYANNWLYMYLYEASDAEVETLKNRVSKPDSVQTRESWSGGWRFHVATEADLDLMKEIVTKRLEARKATATAS